MNLRTPPVEPCEGGPMSQRLWLAVPVVAASMLTAPDQRPARTNVPSARHRRDAPATAQQARSAHPHSTIRSSSLSPSTTPSIALVRDVRQIDLPRGVFDLAIPGHRRDGESGDGPLPILSPNRPASACWNRTTSTTSSSPTSSCASTSDVTSRSCACVRRTASPARKPLRRGSSASTAHQSGRSTAKS